MEHTGQLVKPKDFHKVLTAQEVREVYKLSMDALESSFETDVKQLCREVLDIARNPTSLKGDDLKFNVSDSFPQFQSSFICWYVGIAWANVDIIEVAASR